MAERILRTVDIGREFGIPKTTLRRLVAEGHFPRPLRLGGPNSTSIGWHRSEVEDWVASRDRVDRERFRP